LDETTVCNEATETKPHPGLMQSIEERQEIPKGEATVMPVGEPRERRRVCNLAAERRLKRKERTRGYSGSRRKSAAACRKMTRRAKVAWRKRNIIRKIRIQASRESRKELAVARRQVSRRAETAWRKRNIARKECTKANVVQEIQRGRTFGRRRQQEPECSNGIRSRGVEEQVQLRKGRKTAKSIGGRRKHQPRLESMGNSNKVFRKTMGMELVKRANWTAAGYK
jgi:hypothetical protein